MTHDLHDDLRISVNLWQVGAALNHVAMDFDQSLDAVEQLAHLRFGFERERADLQQDSHVVAHTNGHTEVGDLAVEIQSIGHRPVHFPTCIVEADDV